LLNSFDQSWQAQVAVNDNLLTEDARDFDAQSRNIRSAPFLRPITLTAYEPRLKSRGFSIEIDKEQLTMDLSVVRPRTISEDMGRYTLWTMFCVSLLFVSGLGWLLIERLWRIIRSGRKASRGELKSP
jgi:hypothetical protein